MKIFSQFRQRLVHRYIRLTGIIIFALLVLVYGFACSLVYNNAVSQAHLLATEEAEELSYIINNGQPLLGITTNSIQSQKYLDKVFYYMYDKNGKIVKMDNKIKWSRTLVERLINEDLLINGETKFHFVITPKYELRFFTISREAAYYNNIYVGKVYVGIDISKDFMFLGRLLLWIIILWGIALLGVNKAAKYMANKAMQPIIESFEKQILFAANASHELRTPLSVLLSGLDVLKDDTDNKLTVFSQEIMGDMKSEILKMKMLIGNLLLLARCDSSAIGIKKQKIIINDVVNGVAVRFLSIAEDKNIKIVIVNKNDQIKTYFDRSHLQQILTILIDNAVKYTPKNGHITLSIDKETIPVVSVVNTGCGISAEDLPHIFERFYRSITVQKYDGSGLGLSIAKALAEKNGGRLAAESRENVDTTFFLYLPPTE